MAVCISGKRVEILNSHRIPVIGPLGASMASGMQPVLSAKDGAKNNALRANATPLPEQGCRKKRILHVEFDRTLLATRHALLETAGCEVVSCFHGMAAREVAAGSMEFDVFLVGHAASVEERSNLVSWMKAHFPKVAIVALRSRDTDGSPGGDVNVTSDPEELLKAILDVLRI